MVILVGIHLQGQLVWPPDNPYHTLEEERHTDRAREIKTDGQGRGEERDREREGEWEGVGDGRRQKGMEKWRLTGRSSE